MEYSTEISGIHGVGAQACAESGRKVPHTHTPSQGREAPIVYDSSTGALFVFSLLDGVADRVFR